jgi:hypothetical protein
MALATAAGHYGTQRMADGETSPRPRTRDRANTATRIRYITDVRVVSGSDRRVLGLDVVVATATNAERVRPLFVL